MSKLNKKVAAGLGTTEVALGLTTLPENRADWFTKMLLRGLLLINLHEFLSGLVLLTPAIKEYS